MRQNYVRKQLPLKDLPGDLDEATIASLAFEKGCSSSETLFLHPPPGECAQFPSTMSGCDLR